MNLDRHVRPRSRPTVGGAALAACLGLAALLACGSTWAAPLACTLAADPKTVARQGGEKLNLPRNLDDCSGVKVVSGAVVACIQDRLDALRCKTIEPPETISSGTFGNTVVHEWRKSLVKLFSGGFGASDAKSRSAIDSLPNGPVLMAAPSFDIDFTQPLMTGVQAVEFREAAPQGALLVRVPAIGVRTVDASLFAPGKAYSWAVVPSGKFATLHGQFTMADATTRRKAQAHAQKAVGAQPDPRIQAVLRADSFFRDGYVFDAAQAVKQGFQAD